MSEKDNGGPAFPGLNPAMTGIDSDGFERWETEPSGGMSLRDYFAAKAMASVIAIAKYPWVRGDVDLESVAKAAYLAADAMLKARDQ
ncbi:hypothetical protein [Eleftheria terrae]|uniref:hypothetical protein n=1 Tax=Eleftheria terrae TaxID=1597781 RepID=UPI00263BE69C|nr:hypothetical protein [Eleftheria terrae]WKB53007.1 hypothetical protein N7L95_00970 [Eleftheria terrae]